MRVAAFGDLHLDSAFVSCGIKNSVARRELLRKVFLNIISEVKASKSDLLLISGDLFDTQAPTNESVKLVSSELASLEIPVFISPGNHDPYTQGGVFDLMPSNVYVFRENKLESIILPTLNVCVDGFAYTSDTYEASPLKDFKPAKDRIPHLLCAHTDMTVSSKYAPITQTELKNTDYIFAALGHIHTKTDDIKAGNCLALYSGVMQGRAPDEVLSGSLNIVDIDTENRSVSSVDKVKVAIWDNLTYEISLDGVSSDSEAVKRITSELSINNIGELDLVRVELVGEYDCYYSPNPSFILSEIKKALDKDDVTMKIYATPSIDKDTLMSDPSVIGVLYRSLFEDQNIVDKYPEDIRLRAFKLSLKALKGDDIDPDNI